jgi:serine/threonine protein kinase
MALPEHSHRNGGLRLDTGNGHGDGDGSTTKESRPSFTSKQEVPPARALPRGSEASEDTIKLSTRSLEGPNEEALERISSTAPTSDPLVEQYLRDRKPSVSFNNEVKLDTGHRQSMLEPLDKPAKVRPRGRSLLQAISDERSRAARAHSESDSVQYDPVTGKHLPQFSTSPPQNHPRIGMGGFPLLQSTVDELARESQTDLSNIQSMTSESTISPKSDDISSPQDDRQSFMSSSAVLSPYQYASSYEPPKRTASQRWRDGENSVDFFSRAGSVRKNAESGRRLSRRETSGSTRSPHSAASSFLRAFSSHNLEDGDRSLECDAEGQTIGDDYVLGKQIGFGGFSVIKEVTKMSATGRQTKLAVKIVRKNISGKSEEENEQAQAEFEHEVELWRHLNHPRILPLEAVYKTDEATFCFIPLNMGGTLFDLVRVNRTGLRTELSKRYAYQLASGLRYLHSDARVVHRDVKLENVLIDTSKGEPGEVRLCDFGMAEWISNDDGGMDGDRPPRKNIGPADTSSSAFAGGSLEYASPEILKMNQAIEDGESERPFVSSAVDVWAFGVCVYCMVVGSRPFANAFQPRIVMAILANDWSREKLLEKGGEECLELVEGCLESEVEKRLDIHDVLAARWLRDVAETEDSEERSKEDGEVGSTGWRL